MRAVTAEMFIARSPRCGNVPPAGLGQPHAVSHATAAPQTDHRPSVSRSRSGAKPPSLAVDPEDLAGPDSLGRSLVVGEDHAIPGPWTECPVLEIDLNQAVERHQLDVLQKAWSLRQRMVFRLTGGGVPDVVDTTTNLGMLSPTSEVDNERLRFLLTANVVDVSSDATRFDPLQRALAAGGAFRSGDGDEPGELSLADGSSAWVDGGPLDLALTAATDLGAAALVPRCHLVAGLLRPLRSPSVEATDTLSELAPDQLEAVQHQGGPARILAPAGSGKTRVLTERVRYLVDQCGLDPDVLGLVAYNRRAKAEMAGRLAGTGRYNLDGIRTLNSLALAIATGRSGFTGGSPATTIDEREVRRILSGMMPRQRRRQLNDPLEPWVDALSMTRLGLRDPEEVADQFSGDLDGFPDVMDRYRRHLADNGLLDFDEQIVRALEILASSKSARAQARRLMPLVLIDEFQDLTPAHLLLIRLIAGPASEVFAVGDDDQTIYSYSGASPRWLIEFEQFFPHASSHFLTVNYRCPADVVEAADNLLSHNRHRVQKSIAAGSEAEKPVPGVEPLHIYSKGDPQENLVEHVTKLLNDGVEPGHIAVLARVNAALIPALLYLSDAGVQANRPPGVDVSMLDRSGAGAALAWLRLATAPTSGLQPDDLRLALRRPPRSVHPRIVDWICEQSSVWHLEKLADRLNTERDADAVEGLAADISDLQAMVTGSNPADTETVLNHVLHEIGLLGAAGQLDGSQRTARRAAHSDELLALLAVARLHPNPETFESWLRKRLMASPVDGGTELAPEGITLATVHTTKGLEWPHVIVHDVRDGLYPHRLAEDQEEERRIFHVAITRGRHSVALTGSGPRSPFVAELDDKRTEPWPTEPVVKRSQAVAPKAKQSKGKPARAEPTDESEAKLRDLLTDWRRQRAKDDAVPAYVVLNNKTLDAIAASAPTSLVELSAVPGIGPSRLDQYGDEILGVVAAAG